MLTATLAIMAMLLHLAVSSVHIVAMAEAAFDPSAASGAGSPVLCLNTGALPPAGFDGDLSGGEDGDQLPYRGMSAQCGHCALGSFGCSLPKTVSVANDFGVAIDLLQEPQPRFDRSRKLAIANLHSRGPPA
ncbi:MAG: hypothetical protein AAFV69_02335 [Pseudomonadota bacterium]